MGDLLGMQFCFSGTEWVEGDGSGYYRIRHEWNQDGSMSYYFHRYFST